jgi:hypothetical protein
MPMLLGYFVPWQLRRGGSRGAEMAAVVAVVAVIFLPPPSLIIFPFSFTNQKACARGRGKEDHCHHCHHCRESPRPWTPLRIPKQANKNFRAGANDQP